MSVKETSWRVKDKNVEKKTLRTLKILKKIRKKKYLANQLYKVHKKCYRARSETPRRVKDKNVEKTNSGNLKNFKKRRKKNVMQISYTRYINNYIEPGQLQRSQGE